MLIAKWCNTTRICQKQNGGSIWPTHSTSFLLVVNYWCITSEYIVVWQVIFSNANYLFPTKRTWQNWCYFNLILSPIYYRQLNCSQRCSSWALQCCSPFQKAVYVRAYTLQIHRHTLILDHSSHSMIVSNVYLIALCTLFLSKPQYVYILRQATTRAMVVVRRPASRMYQTFRPHRQQRPAQWPERSF